MSSGAGVSIPGLAGSTLMDAGMALILLATMVLDHFAGAPWILGLAGVVATFRDGGRWR